MIDTLIHRLDKGENPVEVITTCFGYKLEWGELQDTWNKLVQEYISRPQGYDDTTLRSRLKLLLLQLKEKSRSYKSTTSVSFLCQHLLSIDFASQKKILQKNGEEKVGNFIVMHGTPSCGLQYFIMHRHKFHQTKPNTALIIPIKADTVSITSRDDFSSPVWTEIAVSLEIKFDYIHEIITRIKDRLNEKPIVIVFYNIESWGEACVDIIGSIVSTWIEPKSRTDHSLYMYFLRTDGQSFSENSYNFIVLPPIKELTDDELSCLSSDYEPLFDSCDKDISNFFLPPQKLSSVIDTFLQYSSCKDELMQHFNKLQLT